MLMNITFLKIIILFLKNLIKSWQDNNLIKSNIYEKKLYEINAFKIKKVICLIYLHYLKKKIT